MLDGITLDQLRIFIAAADERSFSAAARRVGRAQSVISKTLANLEEQLGIKLFDRSCHYPVLTEQGRILLDKARIVVGDIDTFKAHGKSLAGGREPHLSIVVDAMFPMANLTETATDFLSEFGDVPLRLDVEPLEGIEQPVLDKQCAFGIMGSLPLMPPEFTSERLFAIKMVLVVSSAHPLAHAQPPVPAAKLAEHLKLTLVARGKPTALAVGPANQRQLALADFWNFSEGREFDVRLPRVWRLTDLGAKHAFLRAGLGWGSMPEDLVAPDIASGLLTEIHADNEPPEGYVIMMFAIYRSDTPPGPAGRWFIDRLRAVAAHPRLTENQMAYKLRQRHALDIRRGIGTRRR